MAPVRFHCTHSESKSPSAVRKHARQRTATFSLKRHSHINANGRRANRRKHTARRSSRLHHDVHRAGNADALGDRNVGGAIELLFGIPVPYIADHADDANVSVIQHSPTIDDFRRRKVEPRTKLSLTTTTFSAKK